MAEGSKLTSGVVAGQRQTGLIRRIANLLRIRFKDARDRGHRVSRAEVIQARQAGLLAFYERYEDYVEILCDAAQFGPTVRAEASYARTRDLLRTEYDPLRPFLKTFLRPADCAGDPFEVLLSAESVSDFLHTDDGETIARITVAREALNLYGEHLRQLADRTG